MIFEIRAKREKILLETIEGSIKISKEEVMRVTGCPSVEDGDSTAWYSYVQEAVELGASFTQVEEFTKHGLHSRVDFSDVEINW